MIPRILFIDSAVSDIFIFSFVQNVTFSQPAKKKARRQTRQEKAAKMAPRPTQLLRPAVHCPTIKVRLLLLWCSSPLVLLVTRCCQVWCTVVIS